MKPKPTRKDIDIAKQIGIRKLTKVFTQLYNTLCRNCQAKVINNPKLDLKQYCIKCSKIIKEKLKDTEW